MVFRYVSIWIDKCDIWTISKTLDLRCMAYNIWYMIYGIYIIYTPFLFIMTKERNAESRKICCAYMTHMGSFLQKTSPFPTFLLPGTQRPVTKEQLRNAQVLGSVQGDAGGCSSYPWKMQLFMSSWKPFQHGWPWEMWVQDDTHLKFNISPWK